MVWECGGISILYLWRINQKRGSCLLKLVLLLVSNPLDPNFDPCLPLFTQQCRNLIPHVWGIYKIKGQLLKSLLFLFWSQLFQQLDIQFLCKKWQNWNTSTFPPCFHLSWNVIADHLWIADHCMSESLSGYINRYMGEREVDRQTDRQIDIFHLNLRSLLDSWDARTLKETGLI